MKSGFDFWKFMIDTAAPVLYWSEQYNGQGTIRRDRQYMEDMTSFRVGSVRMRQNRVVPGVLIEPKIVFSIHIFVDIIDTELYM